jgi:PTH2 family peptidyl-tRNA hydrolase
MNTKQVIVVRKDLNMRKGKMCAQASHASMSFLTKAGGVVDVPHSMYGMKFQTGDLLGHADEMDHWLNNSFKKIVCSVNSEAELIDLHVKAISLGLVSHLITDNGATEFNGIPTKTCLAIGPHWDEKFENLTSHLPLL